MLRCAAEHDLDRAGSATGLSRRMVEPHMRFHAQIEAGVRAKRSYNSSTGPAVILDSEWNVAYIVVRVAADL